ncbi:MAG: caspase family protein, partial [Bacteroidales bacterium]
MFRIVLIFIFSFTTCFIIKAQVSGESKSGFINISKNKVIDKSGIEKPVIDVFSPVLNKDVKSKVNTKQVEITGKIETSHGIYEVLVNGTEALLSQDGTFQTTVLLIVGDNIITIEATDGKQNKTTETYIIERVPAAVVVKPVTGKPQESINIMGKYYALIIAINEYDDPVINDLDQPLSDAQKLYNTLIAQYTFDAGNVKFLKNVKRKEIIIALDELSEIITSSDNLLIFYAGHGYWDNRKETGYWLPSDAQRSNTANWLRNTTMQGYIDDINSKHTLLVTDACFGGSIFKTRKAFNDASIGINKLYELNSRKAMTSGTLKEVPDKSVF